MVSNEYTRYPSTSGVTSINGSSGAINLLAGSGITISTVGTNITISTSASGGTVTNVSVVPGNGLSGTVSNPTTTPAITLSTTVTGILQGNGTAISAASTTGSGSVVLATSPTLVTPNLGTPSAAVLTSATGLPLTTGVTGVLPIANGGTNNSSAYTAGSVIFSNGTLLAQDNANFFWNDTNFSLGLGTNVPGANTIIDAVNSNGAAKSVRLTGYGVSSSVGIKNQFARGTLGSPAPAQSGDLLGFISGTGYGTSFPASTGVVNIVAGETFSGSSNATYLQFMATPTGSVAKAEHMRVSGTGVTLGPQSSSTDVHQINGGLYRTNRTITGSLTVDTTTTDDIIYCNNSAAINITLPAPTSGRTLVIKDVAGTANTNNVTIIPAVNTTKIEGLASNYIFQTNFGSIVLSADGTNWWFL